MFFHHIQTMDKNSKNKKLDIKDMAIISLFAALVSVLSAIPVGFNILGVPATLQTFIIAFVGYTLGAKKGTFVVFIYILLGAIGLPVFNGFNGGFGVILGVTGGFIIGFIFLSFLAGCSMQFKNIFIRIGLGILGLLTCHVTGAFAASIYLDMPLLSASSAVSFPYLPKDILSVVLGYFAAIAVRKAMVSAKIYS